LRQTPISPRFPYTTLFRSQLRAAERGIGVSEREWRTHLHVEIEIFAIVRNRMPARRLVFADEFDSRSSALVIHRERPIKFRAALDRKSTRLNSSHLVISYA